MKHNDEVAALQSRKNRRVHVWIVAWNSPRVEKQQAEDSPDDTQHNRERDDGLDESAYGHRVIVR